MAAGPLPVDPFPAKFHRPPAVAHDPTSSGSKQRTLCREARRETADRQFDAAELYQFVRVRYALAQEWLRSHPINCNKTATSLDSYM
jgi:hypothetical protein